MFPAFAMMSRSRRCSGFQDGSDVRQLFFKSQPVIIQKKDAVSIQAQMLICVLQKGNLINIPAQMPVRLLEKGNTIHIPDQMMIRVITGGTTNWSSMIWFVIVCCSVFIDSCCQNQK
jgi:hypothetical protein